MRPAPLSYPWLLLLVCLLLVSVTACGQESTSDPPTAPEQEQALDLRVERIRSWLRVRGHIGEVGAGSPEAERVLLREGWTSESFGAYEALLRHSMFALRLHEQSVVRLQELVAGQRKFVERIEADADMWFNPDPAVRQRYAEEEKRKLAAYQAELDSHLDGTAYPEAGWKNLLPIIELADALRAARIDEARSIPPR